MSIRKIQFAFTAVICTLYAASVSNAAESVGLSHASEQGAKDEWHISNSIGNFDRPGFTYYLIKQENGKWKAEKVGDVRDENVEKVKVDAKNKTVYLDAPLYYPLAVNSMELFSSKPCSNS